MTDEIVRVPDEVVLSKIYMIGNQKVMLDSDLAELYGVETKRLNEQVRRNPDRFPEDFMFHLTQEESEFLRSQFATSKIKRGGRTYLPHAFTEHGVLMLSSVLNSKQAIQVNIHIMRVYTRIRELFLSDKDVVIRIEQVERQMTKQDQKIELLFTYLDKFIDQTEKPREKIGFKVKVH